MSAVKKLLERDHREITKRDLRLLFELLCAGETEEKVDIFILSVNAHSIREIGYFITGPFSLEHDGVRIGDDGLHISGRCAHTNRQMDMRLVDMPDSPVTGVVEVRYHDDKWDESHLGDLRIWIPKN